MAKVYNAAKVVLITKYLFWSKIILFYLIVAMCVVKFKKYFNVILFEINMYFIKSALKVQRTLII